MNTFTYILFSIFCTISVVHSQILVPVEQLTGEQNVKIKELICPVSLSIDKNRESTEVEVKVMTSISAKRSALAFDCMAIVKTTSTFTNFAFVAYTSYHIKSAKVSEFSCSVAIQKFIDNGHIDPICDYPESDWSYLKTINTEKLCFRVRLSEWDYDFLKKGYLYQMFPNSLCKNDRGCLSIDSEHFFRPMAPMECPHLWSMRGSYNSKTGVFTTPWGKKLTVLSSSCVKVCDLIGFASTEGHFVQITGLSCSNPVEMSEVRELTEGYIREGEILGSEQSNYHMICEVVHRLLESQGLLKPSDMKFFYPSTEGQHHLYRVIDGKLQTSLFELKRISLTTARSTQCRIQNWNVQDCFSKTTWGGLTFDHEGFLRPGVYMSDSAEFYREISQDENGIIDKSKYPERYLPSSAIDSKIEHKISENSRNIYLTIGGGLSSLLILFVICALLWKLLMRRGERSTATKEILPISNDSRPVNIGIFPSSGYEPAGLVPASNDALVPYSGQAINRSQMRSFNF